MSATTSAGSRLYGMMQFLLATYAAGQKPTPAEPRNVIELQDALDAVIQLAGFLDANAQSGRISRNDAEHMNAMLMTIRDYLQPLPVGDSPGPGGQTVDGVTPDLKIFVDLLRHARSTSGWRG